MKTVPADQLADYVGREVGVSDWFTVDQERVDAFADVTLDYQYIHVDPAAAQLTPWGTTVAHGFLTLSLITHLTGGVGILPEGTMTVINYGLDRVRFLEPVRVGSNIRARVVLEEITDKGPGRILLKSNVTVEIDNNDKPAMVAETLMMALLP